MYTMYLENYVFQINYYYTVDIIHDKYIFPRLYVILIFIILFLILLDEKFNNNFLIPLRSHKIFQYYRIGNFK